MIRVQASQEEALTAQARHDFHLRLCDYLRAHFPEDLAGLDEPALLGQVRIWEARAAARGGTTELAIAQWACLSLSFGRQPDELDELRDVLRSGSAPIEDTLDKLIGYLSYYHGAGVRIDA